MGTPAVTGKPGRAGSTQVAGRRGGISAFCAQMICTDFGFSIRVQRVNLIASEGEDLNRVGYGASHPQPLQQEPAMKVFILAAIAALSLGIGSAYAHKVVVNRNDQVIWGPSYTPAPPGTGE